MWRRSARRSRRFAAADYTARGEKYTAYFKKRVE
jgi:hypothetical protein